MLQFSACTLDLPCKSSVLLVMYARALHSCGMPLKRPVLNDCFSGASRSWSWPSGPLLTEPVYVLGREAATTKLPSCLPSLCAAWPSHCLHRETLRSFPGQMHQHHGSVSGEQWDQRSSLWVDLQFLSPRAVSLWKQTGKDVWHLSIFEVYLKLLLLHSCFFSSFCMQRRGKTLKKMLWAAI